MVINHVSLKATVFYRNTVGQTGSGVNSNRYFEHPEFFQRYQAHCRIEWHQKRETVYWSVYNPTSSHTHWHACTCICPHTSTHTHAHTRACTHSNTHTHTHTQWMKECLHRIQLMYIMNMWNCNGQIKRDLEYGERERERET